MYVRNHGGPDHNTTLPTRIIPHDGGALRSPRLVEFFDLLRSARVGIVFLEKSNPPNRELRLYGMYLAWTYDYERFTGPGPWALVATRQSSEEGILTI